MKYACFSSTGRLFFSVLRGGGDEMGREGTTKRAATAMWLPAVGPTCMPEVRHTEWKGGGADLILSVDSTRVGCSDEKRRKSKNFVVPVTNMFLNLWLLKS